MAKIDETNGNLPAKCCRFKCWHYIVAGIVIFVIGCIIGKISFGHHGHDSGKYGQQWAESSMKYHGNHHGKRNHGSMGNLLKVVDKDGDYQITKQEFDAFFEQLDTNNDGIINNEITQFKKIIQEQHRNK